MTESQGWIIICQLFFIVGVLGYIVGRGRS